MKWAEKTRRGIEEWFTGRPAEEKPSWAERIGGWLASVFMGGAIKTMDFFEPDLREEIEAPMKRLKDIPNLPPDIGNILDRATGEKKAVQAAAIVPFLIGILVGFAFGIAQPVMRWGSYLIDKLIRSARLDPATAIHAYYRGLITEDKLNSTLSDLGWSDDDIATWQAALKHRLDPLTVTLLYRRDKEKYDKLWQDLKDEGWDDERIEAYKELVKVIPPLADMVRFADYSAFDPEVIEKWREFYDAPDWIRQPMALVGIVEEWANKYWFSHWVQPGRFELGEMHRRGLITDDEVMLAYKTMGYSSYWQKKLLNLVKAVPTRVDVRRWWDMRTINEDRLKEIYHAQGYYDKDLDDYVLWTKVYVAFPDLIARWRNGWITEDEVKSELTAIGMPEERATELIETKKKEVNEEIVADERALTKAEVYAGVKKGVISWEEGLDLLQDLGYSTDDATFILETRVGTETETPEIAKKRDLTKADILNAIKKEVLSIPEGRLMLEDLGYSKGEADILIMVKLGVSDLSELDATLVGASPASYLDFKVRTQRYRLVTGKEAKLVKPELLEAERVLREAEFTLKTEKAKGTKDEKLAPFVKAVSNAQLRYRQLLATFKQKG